MVMCVGIKRDTKNRVLGYYLMGKPKAKTYIDKNNLKTLIKNGCMQVDNLTLTSDNRLVLKDIKGKAVAAYQRKENMPKKSLKEMVLVCGDKGYDYEGLHYFIEGGKVAVRAFNKEIKEAKILRGAERIVERAFSRCVTLNNVVIPDSVTSIGEEAFYMCDSLMAVTIPDSVTSIDGVFRNCFGLQSVTIGSGITNIGEGAFSHCINLTTVKIPDSITSIRDRAFRSCIHLADITIPKKVTRIGVTAFQGCNSLINIVIPDSVTSIGDRAFYNCVNLKEVKIPKRFKNLLEYGFDRGNINFDFY